MNNRLSLVTSGFAALMATCWLSACMAPAPATPSGQPKPVTANDLSGTWVADTAAVPEPPAGPFLDCRQQPVLVLSQTGETLTAKSSWFGVMPADASSTSLSGRIQDGKVTLTGQRIGFRIPTVTLTYELTFNPATQHLTGTENGKAFWMVPLGCNTPLPMSAN